MRSTGGDEGLPPPPAAGSGGPTTAVLAPPRSLRGLTTAIVVLLVLAGAAAVGQLASLLALRSALDDVGAGDRSFAALVRIENRYNASEAWQAVGGLVSVGVLVLLIIWTYRSHKNLDSWPATEPRLGHGMAIGSWFIPLFFFLGPYWCMSDAYRGADPQLTSGQSLRTRPASRLALAWWTTFVVAYVCLIVGESSISGAAGILENDSPAPAINLADDPQRSYDAATTMAIATALLIAAAVLGALAVRQLGKRQELRQKQWYDEQVLAAGTA